MRRESSEVEPSADHGREEEEDRYGSPDREGGKQPKPVDAEGADEDRRRQQQQQDQLP